MNQNPLSVSLKNVWAGYYKQPVLQDVTLSIKPGDFVGIIGPNGGGKSTLIKVILGLIKPVQGQVLLSNSEPQAARKRVGYLPQLTQIDFNFPATVLDVVMMGLYGKLGLGKNPTKSDQKAALDALAQVEMSDYYHIPIGKLSGGQRQRTFIARAICQKPDLLILDEPIAGVDITTQHALSHLFEELNKQGITIISTTHDLNCVASSFNSVICLNRRLIAIGKPQDVLKSEILNETFGSHLLMADAGEKIIAAHDHIQNYKQETKQ